MQPYLHFQISDFRFMALILAAAFFAFDCHAQSVRFASPHIGHIFPEEKGVIGVVVDNAADVAGGDITIRDEFGGEVLRIPVSQNVPRYDLELGRGFYRLDVSIQSRSGSKVSLSTTAAVVGVGIRQEDREQSSLGFFSVDVLSKQAVVAGGRWNRVMIHLKGYAKDGSGYKWTYPWQEPELPSDQLWIGQLTVIPAWLRGASGEVGNADMYPPKDWGEFRNLVQSVVKSRKPAVSYIEILNEPEWHWKGSDIELVRYFKEARTAINQSNVDVKVLGPSFATIDMPKFRKLVELGLLDSLDGVAMHAYVKESVPEADFIERVRALKNYLSSIGKGAMPVFLTEFGWTTGKGTWQPPVDDITQAQYLSRALLLLSTVDIKAALVFCLRWQSANPGEAEFSILNKDYSPKVAFPAYATTARWLAGIKGEGRLTKLADDVYVLIAEKKSVTHAAMVWKSKGKARITIPCATKRIEDLMGRKMTVQNGCQLEVGEAPIFFEYQLLSPAQLKVVQ